MYRINWRVSAGIVFGCLQEQACVRGSSFCASARNVVYLQKEFPYKRNGGERRKKYPAP